MSPTMCSSASRIRWSTPNPWRTTRGRPEPRADASTLSARAGEGGEETGEAVFDVVAAERDALAVPVAGVVRQAGLAEDAEVEGARRLRDREFETHAGAFG